MKYTSMFAMIVLSALLLAACNGMPGPLPLQTQSALPVYFAQTPTIQPTPETRNLNRGDSLTITDNPNDPHGKQIRITYRGSGYWQCETNAGIQGEMCERPDTYSFSWGNIFPAVWGAYYEPGTGILHLKPGWVVTSENLNLAP